MEYTLCVICQRKTDEDLTCPTDSKRKDVGAGYLTAERDFKDFSKYSALPSFMKLGRIDNGSGIQSTLHQNRHVGTNLVETSTTALNYKD